MKKELLILIFIILLSTLSLAENNLSQEEPIFNEIYIQSAFICFPHNLTTQTSLAECFTYSIYGTNDEENIKWLNQGISLHLIFHNESYDLGIKNISYDEFIEVGNLISGYGFNHSYDRFNQLNNSIDTLTGALINSYSYNHEGNRIKKVDYNINENKDNRTTYYIDESFIQIRYTNGTIINESYYYIDNKLVVMEDNNNKMFYYHPDHLGSTSLVTNQTQDIIEEEFYLPYGDNLDGNENSRFLFNSKEKDRTTDLYYYGARYYSPFASQFIQADSVILDIYNPQDLNRYSYVRNNPYKYVDTTGNTIEPVTATIVIGFIAIGAATGFSETYFGNEQATWVDVADSTIAGAAGGGAEGVLFIAGAVNSVLQALDSSSPAIGSGITEIIKDFIDNPPFPTIDEIRNSDELRKQQTERRQLESTQDKEKDRKDKSQNKIDSSSIVKDRRINELSCNLNSQCITSKPYSGTEDPGPDGVIYAYGSRVEQDDKSKIINDRSTNERRVNK